MHYTLCMFVILYIYIFVKRKRLIEETLIIDKKKRKEHLPLNKIVTLSSIRMFVFITSLCYRDVALFWGGSM